MRKKAEELKSTAAQLQTRLRRVQERRKKDTEEHKKFGCTPAVKAMIPAIENLERALNYPQVDKESLMKGVRLSLEQLANDLAKAFQMLPSITFAVRFSLTYRTTEFE